MSNENSEKLTILIAEDSEMDRMILESIVRKSGHEPICVVNGIEAVKAFEARRPDLVFLDVLMPEMGGIEAIKKIRKIAHQDFIPILFLTSLSDQESLVECLEAGGDDFIPKPYNSAVLNSKIAAFQRMRNLHITLADQKEQIENHNLHLLQEQRVAKQVFDRIAHSGCLKMEIIRQYLSPLAVFNGDILVGDISPNGSMMILLGDFTGHGLPAAVGSIPLTTAFYGMVRKGFHMDEILSEINNKLHNILPTGLFCCAIFVDINFQKHRIRIWNGGLPEAFLYKKKTNDYQLFESKHLPLGVLPNKDFKCETERIEFDEGDRIFMWSDGVIESCNKMGEMFGEERLHSLMNENRGSEKLFNLILENVHNHIGTSEKMDDISLVEIEMQDIDLVCNILDSDVNTVGSIAEWHLNFKIPGKSLRYFDPLPLLMNIIAEVPSLRPHRTPLYTIVAELYSNALEHGILGLSSKIKESANGFSTYYKMRESGLKEIEDGFISFDFNQKRVEDGGELKIRVCDSGYGFNIGEYRRKESFDNNDDIELKKDYFGRGLSLINSLCQSVTVHAPGNDVEVVYHWITEEV